MAELILILFMVGAGCLVYAYIRFCVRLVDGDAHRVMSVHLGKLANGRTREFAYKGTLGDGESMNKLILNVERAINQGCRVVMITYDRVG